MNEKTDPETQKIQEEQKGLLDLIGHPAWGVARRKLVDRILELQNVSEYIDIIQTGNATKLLKEMKASKRSAEILFSWLQDIEGTAQTAIENKPTHKSYVIELD